MTEKLKIILELDLVAMFGAKLPRSFCAAARSSPEFNLVYRFRLASCSTGLALRWHRWRYKQLRRRFSIHLIEGTEVGAGFRFGHMGSLVVHPRVKIGFDVTICQGVTIGKVHTGRRAGVPTIGDHVYIGANAVVVGGITIGNHVLIAPNSFVNFNVHDHAVVIGNPGLIHSKKRPVERISNLSRSEG